MFFTFVFLVLRGYFDVIKSINKRVCLISYRIDIKPMIGIEEFI